MRYLSSVRSGFQRQEVGLLVVVIALTLVFSTFNRHFLTSENGAFILQSVAVIGIMAIGEVFVLISGEIDLSVGSVLGVTGAWLMAHSANPWLAVFLTRCGVHGGRSAPTRAGKNTGSADGQAISPAKPRRWKRAAIRPSGGSLSSRVCERSAS